MDKKDKHDQLPSIRRKMRLEKQQLMADTKKYKEAISGQVQTSVYEVKETSKHTLVIGAILLGAYGLFYLLLNRSKTKKIEYVPIKALGELDNIEELHRHDPEHQLVQVKQNVKVKESPIITMIKANIAQFLLGIAKNELQRALEQVRDKLYK
ncbi:hypothetical protein V6R21_27375 [Limibacter armeniacum]|uniref:hypothetical protein n=1 Tax=Limibacter armeniacum TaxID=466084 RepID=UPI002FE62EBF